VNRLPIERQVATDRVHRCTDACKYFVSSHHRVAVCTTSLHTHVCGRELCTLATEVSDTTYACPLTGLEIAPPAEQQHVSLRSDTSFNRSSQIHWTTVRCRVRQPATKLQRQVVASTLAKLFTSQERYDIFTKAVARRNADVVAALRRIRQNNPADKPTRTYWAYARVRAVIAAHATFTRPPMDTVNCDFVTYVCNIIHLLKTKAKQKKLPLKKNDACIVFGLAQLFDTGFAPGGVTAIRTVSSVHRHGMSPCQYSKLSCLRARQQTIAVRQIQRVCVDKTGRASLQLPPAPATI